MTLFHPKDQTYTPPVLETLADYLTAVTLAIAIFPQENP